MSVKVIADAIQQMEGWKPGSVSYVNNNPGNIMDLAYYKQTGKFRVQTYPSYAAGRQALESLIGSYAAQGATIESMFRKYAPEGHGNNNPAIYADYVASAVGVPKSTPVSSIISSSSSSASTATIDMTETNPFVYDDGSSSASTAFEDLDPMTVAMVAGAALVVVLLTDR